jgi:tetratricopeptide (TPR) repeat protein
LISKAAEASFARGLEAFRAKGREREALALFEATVTLDSRANGSSGAARYRSYYGLCLGLHGSKLRQGLALCRKAAEEEFYNPEIWRNLGWLEMEAGNRPEAHAAFLRGLRLAPGDAELKQLLTTLGMRRPPMLRFLRRSNPLNVFLGRLTYKRSRGDSD